MTHWYEQYKVTVPEGKVGRAEIEHFGVSEEAAAWANLHMALHGQGRRSIPPGGYTGLHVDGVMVMSDTPAEVRDHLGFIDHVHGQVLINGLGIGLCLQAALRKTEVEHITVVEKESDVLALVAGHYLALFGGARLTFVQADAFTWQPPKDKVYDVVWNDIWPFVQGDFWPQYKQLHRKYARRAKWQGSWCRDWVRRMAKDNA